MRGMHSRRGGTFKRDLAMTSEAVLRRLRVGMKDDLGALQTGNLNHTDNIRRSEQPLLLTTWKRGDLKTLDGILEATNEAI